MSEQDPVVKFELIDPINLSTDPDQPRKYFSDPQLNELKNSITERGILCPLIVREDGAGHYVIIDGARRHKVAVELQLTTVPCIIRREGQTVDILIDQINCNIQREGLNNRDLAAAFRRMNDEFKMTQEQIGTYIGQSKSWVSRMIEYTDLPDSIKELEDSGQLKNVETLITLKKINEKNPEMASQLIEEVKSGKKISLQQAKEVLGTKKRGKKEAKEQISLAEYLPKADTSSADVADAGHESEPSGKTNTLPQADEPAQQSPKRKRRSKTLQKLMQMLGIEDGEDDAEVLEQIGSKVLPLVEKSIIGEPAAVE